MLITALLSIAACGSGQVNSDKKNKHSSVSQTHPEPPGTYIHIAALFGNLEAIHQHIKAGSDLNEKDEYGSSPLIIAATFDKTEVAEALIEAGADVNFITNERS
ncbi:MAG: ankyrin repeat domain-containing protein, partial [Desulfobacula sp.]|nr:ankyrin repeat domain-containing protein [Desulfobacula sp.]